VADEAGPAHAKGTFDWFPAREDNPLCEGGQVVSTCLGLGKLLLLALGRSGASPPADSRGIRCCRTRSSGPWKMLGSRKPGEGMVSKIVSALPWLAHAPQTASTESNRVAVAGAF
jgi:hypothetical protein